MGGKPQGSPEDQNPALCLYSGGEPFLEEKQYVALYSVMWKEPPIPSKHGHQATCQNLASRRDNSSIAHRLCVGDFQWNRFPPNLSVSNMPKPWCERYLMFYSMSITQGCQCKMNNVPGMTSIIAGTVTQLMSFTGEREVSTCDRAPISGCLLAAGRVATIYMGHLLALHRITSQWMDSPFAEFRIQWLHLWKAGKSWPAPTCWCSSNSGK